MATISSTSSGLAENNTSVVVTKPTGLAVGDEMIAVVHINNTTDISNTPTDWIKLSTSAKTDSTTAVVFYKVAVSADVSASDFTFTITTNKYWSVVILRITGQSPLQPLVAYSSTPTNVPDTKTPTINNTITPYPSSLVIFIALSKTSEGNSMSIGSYAIATSNPTWTESFDNNFVGDGGFGSYYSTSIAYASRPEYTATGSSSFTITTDSSAGSCSANAILLSIPTDKSINVSESVSISESMLNNIKIYPSDTILVTETYSNIISRVWTKVTKPITTWINKNKN